MTQADSAQAVISRSVAILVDGNNIERSLRRNPGHT